MNNFPFIEIILKYNNSKFYETYKHSYSTICSKPNLKNTQKNIYCNNKFIFDFFFDIAAFSTTLTIFLVKDKKMIFSFLLRFVGNLLLFSSLSDSTSQASQNSFLAAIKSFVNSEKKY